MKNDFFKLSMDEGAVLAGIKNHYISCLVDVEPQFISLISQAIFETVGGNGPGKPEWRSKISLMLREVFRNVSDDAIEIGIGLPLDLESTAYYTYMKAMVISEGQNKPVQAGPNGRKVFDNNLDGHKKSAAKSTYRIPQFEQEGNHFMDNAVKNMAKLFRDTLSFAGKTLSSSVFCDNVIVK